MRETQANHPICGELVLEGKEGKNLEEAKRMREHHELAVVEETKRLSVVNLRQMLDIRGWRCWISEGGELVWLHT